MAFLAPILIPTLAKITAGVAVGLANASQAEHSDYTFTIGNRVFTTSKPFPFLYLPFELRLEILMMALELSKSLLPPPPPPLPPGHPFLDPTTPLYYHPLNMHHPLYVGPSGERNLNGYPTSAWRWIAVSREWWAVLRPKLWRNVTLRGRWAYTGFLRNLEDADSIAIKAFVRSLELKEGAVDVGQMYRAMRMLPRLDKLIYAPIPKEKHTFPFGVNLIPSDPGPESITIAIPFDMITNPSTRAHLVTLPRLSTLDLALSGISLTITTFLASLPHLRTLTLRTRYLSYASLSPFSVTTQPLQRLSIHAMSIPETVYDELRVFLRSSERLSTVCTVYSGDSVVYAPTEEEALALVQEPEKEEDGKHWERTTNVRLFGGLVGLRMESRA